MSYLLGQMEATRIIGQSIADQVKKMREYMDDVEMGSGIPSKGSTYDIATFVLDNLGTGLLVAAAIMEAKMRDDCGHAAERNDHD